MMTLINIIGFISILVIFFSLSAPYNLYFVFILAPFILAKAFYQGLMEKEKEEYEKQDRAEKYLKLKEDYEITKEYIDDELDSAILINEVNNNIVFITNNLNKMYVYDLADIIQVEIVKDGETVTKTNRTSQFGGVVLGGFIAGDVGALIGGLSAEKGIKEKVRSVDLKILVDDTAQPIVVINFFKAPINNQSQIREAIEVESLQDYKEKIAVIENWYNYFKVIIRRIETEKNKLPNTYTKKTDSFNKVKVQDHNLNTLTINHSSSRINDLNSLVSLYKENLITIEEFESEKNKLLNS